MESKAVVVSTYRFPRYTVFFVDLNLDRERRGQLLDGRSFLLAHLRASEAKEATLFGGFRDLLGYGNQPLVEPLGIRLGLLLDERGDMPQALACGDAN